jgi:phage terminase Nu1 subunit (DNA packaging protein)
MNIMHDAIEGTAPIGEPRSLSKSGFAKVVGLTPGRVSQMIKAGLPVETDGRIDVARGRIWIQDHIDTNRSAAQRQGTLALDGRSESVAAERLRLVKEQADAAALKNAMFRREVVAAADVAREWSAVLRKVRSGVLAVPSRLRQALPHLTAHDVATMDAELRRALEDLANDE